ncbi:hypothetical protein ACFL2V_03985 [Pseudomonadota bacterium]
MRSLLINRARTTVTDIRDESDGWSCWIRKLLTKKSFNTTVVVVANNLGRMALVMLNIVNLPHSH